MFSQCGRRSFTDIWRIACAVSVVSLSGPVLAQSSKIGKIDPKLIGTWHSVEIRCAADEECSNTVNKAQLTIGKTGSFEWMPYRDLEKLDVCSWQGSPDSPNTLNFEDCDVNPDGNSDTFEFRVSGRTLTLTGVERSPAFHELISMRFERGPLVSEWREPRPEVCDTRPLPEWTSSAIQITSDWDLQWPQHPGDDPRPFTAKRNRLLWKALRAYEGNAAPIVLKAISYSIEGDSYEEYFSASRGEAKVVSHEDDGMITYFNTCIRSLPMIKVKVQDRSKLWRFATSAPSPDAPAYIVFPSGGEGAHIFPNG